MKKRRKSKKLRLFNTISALITLFCLISLVLVSYMIFKMNIIPTKYLIVGSVLCLLIILLLLLSIYGKVKKWIKIISLFIVTLISTILCFASFYLNNTYNFLNRTNKKYETLNYSVIVLKNSNYKNILELKNKNISYLDDNYKSDIKKKLTSKITYNELLYSEFGELSNLLINKETNAIVLEDSYLNLVYEEVLDFKDNTEVIYTFTIKANTHKENSDVSVTEQPFILYISGIDQYGNVNSVRGRSDVNQIVVVNPKTNHILLVNTPRDYYVQLAGTTGLKDKLTHAGIYGIDKSISTIENLYNIDIDHYLRVNFNTLIKVVDVIGGIDVYSDKTFNSYHIKGWTIPKGWNHFNGKQALAYARERYAYIDGDHHRGRNQQQVIEAIINKVTQSSVLISKYNSILNALNGSFQTDIPTSTITAFIKYQLDKMPNWNIESIAANGYNSYNYTYSMGYNYLLYVMEPDYNSVETVKDKINEVLNEK